jgi:hypothetical protein
MRQSIARSSIRDFAPAGWSLNKAAVTISQCHHDDAVAVDYRTIEDEIRRNGVLITQLIACA